MHQPLRKVSNPYWVLGLLTLVNTFGFIDRIVIQTLVQPIKIDLALSDAELGILGGLSFAVLHALLSIPVARLAEQRSRVVIIAIGTALWSIATSLCGATANFAQLMLARIGVGIGEAAGVPASPSLISDYCPRSWRASAMAVFMLAVPFGAMIGGAGGGWIAQHYSWRTAFVAAGLPGVVLAILVLLTIREPQRGRFDQEAHASDTPPLKHALRRFTEIRSLRYLVIGTTISTTAGYGINYFIPAYYGRRFGLDFAEAGMISGLIGSVPGILGIIGGGFLADRWARRNPRVYALIPMAGFLLTAPLYLWAFVQQDWVGFSALLAATALIQFSYIPISAAVIQNMMHPRMRASASAIVNLLYSLIGLGLGPLCVGALSDHFGSRDPASPAGGLQHAMMAFALLYVLGGLFLAISSRTVRDDLERATQGG